jgi:hypothetical protein
MLALLFYSPFPFLKQTYTKPGGRKQKNVKTYSLLSQLSRALVLGVSEQFDDAALVGGETSDLTNDVADEGGALAEVALVAGDTSGGLDWGDFL